MNTSAIYLYLATAGNEDIASVICRLMVKLILTEPYPILTEPYFEYYKSYSLKHFSTDY